MAKFAIIKTGGKQYRVKTGDVLSVEKLPKKEGAKQTFAEVLLVGDQKTTKVGTPTVSGAKIEAKILSHQKAKKVQVLKYKSKTRQRKKAGHRQQYTQVEITKI